MKFWSVSTTIRNPDRVRNFLKILKTMEGQTWNKENQKKFQVLLIQNKVYGYGQNQFHNTLSEVQNSILDSDNITYEQAERILATKNYVGGGDMRGRQSYNPLEKMGLAYLDDNNKIKLSSFGNYFLEDNYDLGEVFFRSLIKWQYPSPDTNQYRDGYNIKPFIATLHLISKVNSICKDRGMKSKGISKIEFALFVVSLSQYNLIEKRAIKLVDFREYYESLSGKDVQKEYIEQYFKDNFENYGTWENAKEYTDNIIRYFRLTRYLYIRGNGWYIDLEPRRRVEIDALIANDNASASNFQSKKEYIDYIGNYEKPILPWENEKILIEVLNDLEYELKTKYLELSKLHNEIPRMPELQYYNRSKSELKSYINIYREYRNVLYNIETHYNSQLISNINNYINSLRDIFQVYKNRPVELERFISLGLSALNDAIKIKPNYPVGDDNEPTFTAPSNKPDIECFYKSYYALCEVTLLSNRTQWFNEGQPVMRHIRDFENNYPDKETYCIFIAPKLHRDTINTFWISVKYEYEGKKQKIIPITISQFIQLLEILINKKQNGIFISHIKLKELYDLIISKSQQFNNADEWVKSIPNLIDTWNTTI